MYGNGEMAEWKHGVMGVSLYSRNCEPQYMYLWKAQLVQRYKPKVDVVSVAII